ncbi:hypothetical protein OCT51_12120 [Halomonas sp. LR3S48]|uniref:hypothetical protein n=1 Tax=Halomonas sp. LR3S48 TaxID=2982694 RepID=UPI0021E3BA05|nr:hypothetical protein [Halomonas sp. LR3S48]UYG01951.1 hypothetical protein OCT51_12120 [Halomonas sp. LR3S48]
MILEDLLSRLTVAYGEIKFIYFVEDQARLSNAHLELYDNLNELHWDEITKENEPANAIYILSIPHGRWPNFLEIKKFLSGRRKKVYLLCSKDLFNRSNEIILNSSVPGHFIERVVPFHSLSQDYCIEVSRSDSVGTGYLERAASEGLIERNIRKQLREEILLVKAELIRANLERDTLATERKKLAEEQNRMEAELARLTAEANKSKDLQALLTNTEAELTYHRDRSRSIKATASYQFGNLFVEAARSPKKLLLLPYTVTRFISVGLVKKIKTQRNRKRNISKIEHVNKEKKSLYELVKRTADSDEEKLAAYLTGIEPGKDWVGIIGSSWFSSQFAADEIIQLHPNTWLSLFKKEAPSKILIETSFMDTGGGSWASCLEGGAYGYPYHLIELLSFCRENAIPTTLWHTSESGDGSLALDIFPFLDKILVTSEKDKQRFKELCGGCEHRIEILPSNKGNNSQFESIRNMLLTT